MSNSAADETIEMPSERKFGLTFAAVFLLIAVVPPLFGGHFRWWLLAIAAAFGLIALAVPHVLKFPNKLWFKFGLLLHVVVNPLVLGALFFLVVTPMAIIMRLFRANLLNRTFDPAASTYWISRQPPGPAPESIRNQF